ncbi:MAG: hypothetical protein ACKOOI_05250, partial [Pirellula sp.]
MNDQKQQPTRKSKPLLRRWSTWALLGLVSLIALVGSIPSILGSKWLYQRLVDQLAIEGFELQVESAQFAWFRPLSIQGIELQQVDAPQKSKSLLSIDSIASNRSLMG